MANRQRMGGVFAVQPLPRTWQNDGPEFDGTYTSEHRLQVQLGPAQALPLYSMQGMTAEPGLVAHWAVPARLGTEIKWLMRVVLLSRVPSLKQLRSIGLSDDIRAIIEGGPPEGLVQTFTTLFADKIADTRAAALRARLRSGW